MTGAEIQALVREMLLEDSAAVGSGLVSAANLKTRVQIANQEVWHWAVDAAASTFAKRLELVIPAADGYLDLAAGFSAIELPAMLPVTISGDTIYKPLNVLAKDAAGVFVPLEPSILQDDQIAVESPPFYTQFPTRYYLEGSSLYLAPKPTVDVTIRLSYVPEIAPLEDDEQALAGRLTTFHPLVAYHAAVGLAVKDEKAPAGFALMREELKRSMMHYLHKRQGQKGRKVRVEDY